MSLVSGRSGSYRANTMRKGAREEGESDERTFLWSRTERRTDHCILKRGVNVSHRNGSVCRERYIMDPGSFCFPRLFPTLFNTGIRSPQVIGYFRQPAGQLADLSINRFNVPSTGIILHRSWTYSGDSSRFQRFYDTFTPPDPTRYTARS